MDSKGAQLRWNNFEQKVCAVFKTFDKFAYFLFYGNQMHIFLPTFVVQYLCSRLLQLNYRWDDLLYKKCSDGLWFFQGLRMYPSVGRDER